MPEVIENLRALPGADRADAGGAGRRPSRRPTRPAPADAPTPRGLSGPWTSSSSGCPARARRPSGGGWPAGTARPFVDLDDLIEKAAGRTIPEIFAEDGEAGFRRLEREAVLGAGWPRRGPGDPAGDLAWRRRDR